MVTAMDPAVTVALGELAWTVTDTTNGLTVTAAEVVVEPPGPVAVIVYVVELVGFTTIEPCGPTEPTLGKMLRSVAFVEVHVRVDEPPAEMNAGFACSETVGRGGGGGPPPVVPPPQETATSAAVARKSVAHATEARKSGIDRALHERCSWRRNARTRRATLESSGKIFSRRSAVNGTMGTAAGSDATLIVSVLSSVPFAAKVPDGGLKLHDIPVGKPGQLKVN